MGRVAFDHVTKRYGDVIAVDDLTLDVADQEFLVLVGPSGCGKTTALRMLAGLDDPSSGDILIGERVVTEVAALDRDIAMVFQSYALYPHMTVRRNIEFPLRSRKVPAAERDKLVAEAAASLDLGQLLDRKPAQLSGGQRQRVALARAIVRRPAVFLMDEPLSNLDAKLRVQTRAELVELQRRLATTVVYVTHDQVEAMTMADRIAVMDHGVLQQVGTPLDVYNNPANVFVARFIGAPGMNLLPGKPAESDRGLVIDLGPLGATAPLPERLAAAMRSHSGEILFGFRPEQATLAGEGRGIAAQITAVERIGARTIVHLGEGASAIKVVLDNDQQAAFGASAIVTPNMDAVRIFDRATGQAIGGAGNG
jgi:multiple sugar transport system ATP-binding protein